MKATAFFFLSLLLLSCATPGNVYMEKRMKDDDSSFAYALPYEKGNAYLLIQGYMTLFSHKGEWALDFKMKKGTKVCAARSGVVVATRDDSNTGGLNIKYISEGNHVVVRHDDGSYANYWHLEQYGVLVHPGDSVRQGQAIGLSGNTGYTAFPHLHFEVTSAPTVGRHQIPTRFRTKKGIRYLKPLHWYRAV